MTASFAGVSFHPPPRASICESEGFTSSQVKIPLSAQPLPRTEERRFAWLLSELRANYYFGLVTAGDRLPATRELAKRLHVSPSVALEWYKRLEHDGLVESKQRSGTFLRKIGYEEDRAQDKGRLFNVLTWAAQNLSLLRVSPLEFCRLLLRLTGVDPRTDYRFGLLCHLESFEILEQQFLRMLGFRLPLVLLAQNPQSEAHARATLNRDPTIACLVTTYPYSALGSRLSLEFGRRMIVVRLDQATAKVFEPPATGVRHVVTRDADFAQALRELAVAIWGDSRGRNLHVLSMDETEKLMSLNREGVEAHVSPLCAGRFAALYNGSRCVPLPIRISEHSVNEVLFHYVMASSRNAP